MQASWGNAIGLGFHVCDNLRIKPAVDEKRLFFAISSHLCNTAHHSKSPDGEILLLRCSDTPVVHVMLVR